jgi:hypothetical protein
MFKPLALAAALLSSAPAFADVSIQFMSRDASDPALSTSMTTSYITGALNYTDAATGSFLAYCVEPEQSFAIKSKGFKTYTIGSFSAVQGSMLQALYSSSFGSVHDGVQQAGFQLAVWEIVRENSGTLSLAQNNGNFANLCQQLPGRRPELPRRGPVQRDQADQRHLPGSGRRHADRCRA